MDTLQTSSARAALSQRLSPRFLCAALALACLLPLSAHANVDLADLAEKGEVSALKEALAAGAEVNGRLADGSTALHWAVLHDQHEAVNALLDAGADPAATNRNGITPLFLAVQNGSPQVVSALLQAGADAKVANR